MLGSFKAKGAYQGISYTYKGPAISRSGRKGPPSAPHWRWNRATTSSAATGAMASSSPRGFPPSPSFPPPICHGSWRRIRTGGCCAPSKAIFPTPATSLAENFLLFGLLAEIFMKANGFNGGMGGSMHAFFTPFGAYPNNAIVGASAGIATGAALRKKLAGEASIAVALSGDGSTGCGPVFEAMNFASMAQYHTLWTDARKGGVPVLFCFNNNFYAMGGQTIGETMGWDRLSRIAAGVNPQAMHAETVDGSNPLAVADAVTRKRAHSAVRPGPGPARCRVLPLGRSLDHGR